MKVIPHSGVLSTTNACRSYAIKDHGQGAPDYPMGGAREEGIRVVRAAEARASRPGSKLFVNHSGLFWPPWGSSLTIPKKQRCERLEGATLFLTHTSTS